MQCLISNFDTFLDQNAAVLTAARDETQLIPIYACGEHTLCLHVDAWEDGACNVRLAFKGFRPKSLPFYVEDLAAVIKGIESTEQKRKRDNSQTQQRVVGHVTRALTALPEAQALCFRKSQKGRPIDTSDNQVSLNLTPVLRQWIRGSVLEFPFYFAYAEMLWHLEYLYGEWEALTPPWSGPAPVVTVGFNSNATLQLQLRILVWDGTGGRFALGTNTEGLWSSEFAVEDLEQGLRTLGYTGEGITRFSTKPEDRSLFHELCVAKTRAARQIVLERMAQSMTQQGKCHEA